MNGNSGQIYISLHPKGIVSSPIWKCKINICNTIISVKQKSQTCIEFKVIQKLVQVAHSSLKITVHPRTGCDTPHLPLQRNWGSWDRKLKIYIYFFYKYNISLS